MTLPAILTLVGAGAMALIYLLYPLILAVLSLFSGRRGTAGGSAPVMDYVLWDELKAGTRPVSEAGPAVVVSPGERGRLTPGGIRRLVSPLSEEGIGLVVGRLLIPEVEETERTEGREAAIAQAERIHRGWTWWLDSREALPGVPSGLDGHPFAVRPEFIDANGEVNLSILARSGRKALFLTGRRGLVGRVALFSDLSALTTRITEEKRRGIRSITKRAGNPAVLIRHLFGNLTPLWLTLILTGSILGLVGNGGWVFRVPLVMLGVFALGAVIGRTVYELGYRSKVYFPLWWLALALSSTLKAWVLPGKKNRP